jgi:hypothetical protein
LPGFCKVPNCGRKSYARGLCQTHHRQLLTTHKLKPIRPYRKRKSGTVKFAGLRLTPGCATKVGAYATEQGIAPGAAIAKILEEWVAKGAKRAKSRARGAKP